MIPAFAVQNTVTGIANRSMNQISYIIDQLSTEAMRECWLARGGWQIKSLASNTTWAELEEDTVSLFSQNLGSKSLFDVA